MRQDDADDALDDLAFVERAFARVLGRAVDPRTLREQLEQLAGGRPRAAVLEALCCSDEGVAHAARWEPARLTTVAALLAVPGDRAFVDRAWRLVAAREPADDERRRALDLLHAGGDRRDWLRGLREAAGPRPPATTLIDVYLLDLRPDELDEPHLSLDRILGMPDEAFVFAAYRQLLGRDPDGQGRTVYLSRLRAGASRLGVLQALRGSEEGRRHSGRIEGWTPAAPPWQRAVASLRHAARRLRQVAGRGYRRHPSSRLSIEQDPT